MTDNIGVAVLGTGAIGRMTADIITELPGATLTGLIGSRGELSVDDRTDAVAICTPNGLHVAHARTAVRAGKHVIVEKPLALDIEDGRRLLDEAAAAGVTVSVISQRRWEPVAIAVKAAIASGVLGRPLLGECLLRWRRDRAYFQEAPWRGTADLDGGVLFNQGVHVIDLLRWLLGPVDSVDGGVATRVHELQAPDTAAALLHFASGALGVVAATTAAQDPQPAHLNLWFERGTIRLDNDQLVEWSVPGVPAPTPAPSVGSGSTDPAAIGRIGHRRQWESVVEALVGGRQPEVSGEDALGTAALVAAIHEASRQGRVVPAVR